METKPTWHGIERSDIPWFPTVNPYLYIGCELCFVTCGKSVYEMKVESRTRTQNLLESPQRG